MASLIPAAVSTFFSGGASAATYATAASLAATALATDASISQGQHAKANSKFEERVMQRRALEAEASAQRKAAQTREQRDRVVSRGRAVAASSGAGADDATVEDVLNDVYAKGELGALNDLYEGNMESTNSLVSGESARIEGKRARRQSIMASTGTILDGVDTLSTRYGW